jgi:nitrogenase molybdenum-iron protein alpha/beta subunit
MLADLDVILVDSPGFSGDVETGYKKAISVVNPEIDPERAGVNIDGVCLFDPFSRGNAQEIARLLGMVSVPVGTVFSQDKLDSARHSCPFTVGTNGDFAGGTGRYLGGTLGFDEIRMTFENVKNVWCEADVDVLFAELDAQEERIIRASDKFLRRFDPPGVAIFSGTSYAMFAAGTLSRYIDADIRCIGTRNSPCMSRFPAKMVTGLGEVKALIEAHDPDIVIGSSFERSVAANRGFVGIIPPLKGKIRLAYPALAGICGTLSFMENVLNACMDRKTATWKKRLSLPEE